MPVYTALLEHHTAPGEAGSNLIDDLRQYAHPRLHVTIEAPSKRSAAKQLGESCNTWATVRFTEDWWHERLRLVTSRAERAYLLGVTQ